VGFSRTDLAGELHIFSPSAFCNDVHLLQDVCYRSIVLKKSVLGVIGLRTGFRDRSYRRSFMD